MAIGWGVQVICTNGKEKKISSQQYWTIQRRNFDIDEHPAIQKMLEDRNKELADEYEGKNVDEHRASEGEGKWNLEVEEQPDGEGGFEDMVDFGDLSHHDEL